MDRVEADKAVQQLIAGFETLQTEYQALHGRHQALERSLATAKEQYNELAKLCGSGTATTPPPSSPGREHGEPTFTQTTLQILQNANAQDVAVKVESATQAASSLKRAAPKRPDPGVRIWSGPSADRREVASSTLHSISESPLEEDFTIEGIPSKLGCPFASMANKKMSPHAASVLSRLRTGSTGASGSQFGSDSVSRVNGRDSLSRRGSRRASFLDPIKAEICGLSDHRDEEPALPEQMQQPNVENAESGVCPIRFLDQHSPEEVATYFEKHKHELPRSHEVCVRRYQSNEQQIRQLDEKYGNLVSMIQGLGAKHKGMLPAEPEDGDEVAVEDGGVDEKEAEKVRKWASSVSAQIGDGKADELDEGEAENGERQQHFERPLRDIRVGESPSRPWGISVPPKYLEKEGSEASSRPARVSAAQNEEEAPEPKARCPFGFDEPKTQPLKTTERRSGDLEPQAAKPKTAQEAATPASSEKSRPQMVFNGPVFVGYSAEDAARILRESGWGGRDRSAE